MNDSTYPAVLDVPRSLGTPGRARKALDAAIAIQTELGVNPSGGAATVKARLEAIEAIAGIPVDSDLIALAALSTTSFGRALLEVANAAGLRSAAGLAAVDAPAGVVHRVTNAAATTDVVMVVKGVASQTANLLAAQNSAGSMVAAIGPNGSIYSASDVAAPVVQAIGYTGAYLSIDGTNVKVTNRTTVSNVPLIVKGMASQTGRLTEWQDSTGTPLAYITSGGGVVGQAAFTQNVQNLNGAGAYIGLDGTNVTVFNRNTISAVPLIVKGMAGQTGDLQEWVDSAGGLKAAIYASGSIYSVANIYGASLRDSGGTGPIMTLSSTGTTLQNQTTVSNVPLIVKGMASQSGNLTQWQDSAGTVLALVSANGTIAAGGSGVITNYVQNNASTGPYVQTDGSTVTVFNRTTVGNTPLVVKGIAGQTGPLQSWQDASSNAVASMGYNGSLRAAYVEGQSSGSNPYLQMGNSVYILNRTTASFVPLAVKGMAAQTGHLQAWQDSSGTDLARITSSGNYYGPAVGDLTQTGPLVNLNQTNVTISNRTTTSNVPLIVKGMASQSGNLTEWQDSAATVVAKVDPNGAAFVGRALIVGQTAGALGTNVTGARIELVNVGSAPSTNPTGGGVIYAEAGALKYRGSSGTVTTLAVA